MWYVFLCIPTDKFIQNDFQIASMQSKQNFFGIWILITITVGFEYLLQLKHKYLSQLT